MRCRKVSDAYTTYQLQLPDSQGADDAIRCTELCTLADGYTYYAVPDGVTLPDQPDQISVQSVTLTAELREQIKGASSHCAFIAERMQQMIRARYSPDDEMYFARIGTGAALGVYQFEAGEEAAVLEYGAYVESVRQWGRAERALLGL